MSVGLLLIGSAALAAAAKNVLDIPLASLEISRIRQNSRAPQAVNSGDDTPLSIGGRKFDSGVSTHAESSFWIDLKGQTERFVAWVGVDDEAGQGKGTVIFKVIGDGKTLLFESPVMRGGDAPLPVNVSVRGVKLLELVVGDAGDGILMDYGDLADARFIDAKQQPVAIDPPAEEAVILTPKPSPKPRINGAKVFGVRPGHPFLFRIAATGDRPMTFEAGGLPDGLVLDSATGHISGSVAKRGTYVATLTARNALGTATRELRIVVGDEIALTPPMGWNDWYTFTNSVTAKDIRAAADVMVSTGLADHGYSYVNIDDCWMVKVNSDDPEIGGPTRDAEGRILPNKRFGDMKALTDYIHSKGLKAGIYTSPGPRTCAGYEGAYGHEALDAKQFAEWGFDFLKYDRCSYKQLMKDSSSLEENKHPYTLMGYLLKKQDRDIVYNLCQYGNANVWEWGAEVGGNCWRIAGDIGANPARYTVGFTLNGREKWVGPGRWNDPDYINIGVLRTPTLLTPNEQYTYVTLWNLLAAPLIFSGDMTKLDDFTLSLLSNDEVIEVNQDPLGKQAYRVAQRGDAEVWAKDMEDGSKAVGLLNRGEVPMRVTVKWSDLGVTGAQRVRDLWRQRDMGVLSGSYGTVVPRHGAAMLRLWRVE